jgi:hypothetical protein
MVSSNEKQIIFVLLFITVENISSNRFETKNLKININVKQE